MGRRITSSTNPSTFAELTMTAGGLVTESQLHIIVSRNIPMATVTCSDVNGGSTSFISFELLRKCTVIKILHESKGSVLSEIRRHEQEEVGQDLPLANRSLIRSLV